MKHPPYVEKILGAAQQLSPQPLAGAGAMAEKLALISVIRNERRRLEGFLSHYRQLGVRRFLLIDNDSDDGTREGLAKEQDVTLYAMPGPFSGERKQAWVHAVIGRENPYGWYLVVDADERVVYDGSDQYSLPALVELLERRSLFRARGMLVDLYPEAPLLAAADNVDDRGEEKEEGVHHWFDGNGYRERSVRRMVSRTGGPRERCFALDGEALAPELTKYPLFRARPGQLMANPHHHFPYAENFHSPCYLGMLHEKFRFGFTERVRDAVATGQYWDESREYRAYAQTLESAPALTLKNEHSLQYRSPEDLLRCGLIDPLRWPDNHLAGT